MRFVGVTHGVLSLHNCKESLSAKICTVLFLWATHESLFYRHRWEGSVTMGRANTETVRPITSLNTNWPKQNKEAVVRARGLLRYCQLSKKYSRDIWNSSRYFKIFMYLFHEFSQKPADVLWNTRPEGAGRESNIKHRRKTNPHPRHEWKLFLWPYAPNIQHCLQDATAELI